MKIKLMQNANVLMPAGSVIDLEDSRAALLISIGHAVQVNEKPVERATKAPTEKKTKK